MNLPLRRGKCEIGGREGPIRSANDIHCVVIGLVLDQTEVRLWHCKYIVVKFSNVLKSYFFTLISTLILLHFDINFLYALSKFSSLKGRQETEHIIHNNNDIRIWSDLCVQTQLLSFVYSCLIIDKNIFYLKKKSNNSSFISLKCPPIALVSQVNMT